MNLADFVMEMVGVHGSIVTIRLGTPDKGNDTLLIAIKTDVGEFLQCEYLEDIHSNPAAVQNLYDNCLDFLKRKKGENYGS